MLKLTTAAMSPKVDFARLMSTPRGFIPTSTGRALEGHVPTIAITPVSDGRPGAYDSNQALTWKMVERVKNLITNNVFLPDGTPVRVVVAPEIVYGPRSGAVAKNYYTDQGVSANIWVSRSWAYSDELMSAAMGIGSSEWQQAAYGLNQTDRPGAVWLKAFTAAMDENGRPIFAIYNPDLEKEEGDYIDPRVAEKILRFARCATAVAEMRGKNYLSVGGVSMGIIGSDVLRRVFHRYFGMGTVSYDMVGVLGRIQKGLYDQEEFERAFRFMKENFRFDYNYLTDKRPMSNDDLLRFCIAQTMVVRDLMIGNPKLAGMDVEASQGTNAIAAGTQGQRQWTDLHPNYDTSESLLCSSFDWNGFRAPYVVATENDSKNAIGMLVAGLLTGLPQLFADIRTNWTAASIKAGTGIDVSDVCPRGLIDKRNSGAGALDYGIDPFEIAGLPKTTPAHVLARAFRESEVLQKKLVKAAIEGTLYIGANLQYFPGDGLSSHNRTPEGLPMTAYRYNVVDGDLVTCSIVEGRTVPGLPVAVMDHISRCTDRSWPEAYWEPNDPMTSFEYMNRIGPNHDANSFGLIGADMMTLNAMLRVPVDFHNVPKDQIFLPTMVDRFGGDMFRFCSRLGPVYR